jgi:hypothetical protein
VCFPQYAKRNTFSDVVSTAAGETASTIAERKLSHAWGAWHIFPVAIAHAPAAAMEVIVIDDDEDDDVIVVGDDEVIAIGDDEEGEPAEADEVIDMDGEAPLAAGDDIEIGGGIPGAGGEDMQMGMEGEVEVVNPEEDLPPGQMQCRY